MSRLWPSNRKGHLVVVNCSVLTGCAVLGDVSVVDPLGEERRVIVDVLQVDLHVGVANESVAAVVLSEHCEAPLRPTRGLVAVQRL